MALCSRRAWKTASRFTTCPRPGSYDGRRSLFLKIYPEPQNNALIWTPPGVYFSWVQGVLFREATPCCRVPFSGEAIRPAVLIVAQQRVSKTASTAPRVRRSTSSAWSTSPSGGCSNWMGRSHGRSHLNRSTRPSTRTAAAKTRGGLPH